MPARDGDQQIAAVRFTALAEPQIGEDDVDRVLTKHLESVANATSRQDREATDAFEKWRQILQNENVVIDEQDDDGALTRPRGSLGLLGSR